MAGALSIFNRINYRRGCFMKKSFQRVIATLNLFQGKQSLTICLLAAFFALSACDDSSSASEGNNETSAVESSSSVKDSDSTEESSSSIDKKSSGNETKDKSSSSENKSSSSAKETKNSSDSKSSSSVKSGDSSSSNKDVSSSSSSKKDESSSSSSSVISSDESSSSYTPFVHKSQFLTDSLNTGAYKLFEDPRDHREYWYIKIRGKNRSGAVDSVTVFAHNLNYAEKIVDGELDQTDDESHEKYCFDNDTTMCDRYGGLYQWAEAMNLPSECNAKACASRIMPNHQGICPDGWRLMNYDDYYIIVKSTDQYSEAMRSQGGFYGSNRTGFSGTGAGYRQNRKKQFVARLRVMAWYYPGETVEDGELLPLSGSLSTTQDGWNNDENAANDTKLDGFSVRCVMVKQE